MSVPDPAQPPPEPSQSDVLKEGQEVWVKLLGFDDRGKVRLAMKMVDQETGKEIEKEAAED